MILGILFLAILLTVPLLGGTVSRMGDALPSHIGMVVGSLLLQVLIVSILPDMPVTVAATLHLMSYGLALVFVWHNRAIPGMAILVAGGMMNLAAIAANGGVMPASPEALVRSGKADLALDDEFNNSTVQADAKLQILGDIFAIPEGYPFANVFSIGDVLLVVGGAITVHKVCGSVLGRGGDIDVRRRVGSRDITVSEAYKLELIRQRTQPPVSRRRLPPLPDVERRRRARVAAARRRRERRGASDPASEVDEPPAS